MSRLVPPNFKSPFALDHEVRPSDGFSVSRLAQLVRTCDCVMYRPIIQQQQYSCSLIQCSRAYCCKYYSVPRSCSTTNQRESWPAHDSCRILPLLYSCTTIAVCSMQRSISDTMVPGRIQQYGPPPTKKRYGNMTKQYVRSDCDTIIVQLGAYTTTLGLV